MTKALKMGYHIGKYRYDGKTLARTEQLLKALSDANRLRVLLARALRANGASVDRALCPELRTVHPFHAPAETSASGRSTGCPRADGANGFTIGSIPIFPLYYTCS